MAWLTLWLMTLAQRVRDLAQRRERPSPDAAAARYPAPTQTTSSAPEPNNTVATLVLGACEQLTDAEQALSNLDDASYEPYTISVITNDSTRTHTLTNQKGPLSSVPADALPAHLQGLGLPAADAEAYRAAIQCGEMVVAVSAPAGSAAEILTDDKAQHVTHLAGVPT
jgi:hypothetical protein